MGTNFILGSSIFLTIGIVCVSLLFTGVITVAAIAIPIMWMRNSQKRAEHLMSNGTPGEATILALQDTGTRINDNPRVSMLLEIRMPNMASYQIQKVATVPLIRLSQIQVGSVVPVMVDLSQPTNPDKVGIMLK
jgi:hypothetical protein